MRKWTLRMGLFLLFLFLILFPFSVISASSDDGKLEFDPSLITNPHPSQKRGVSLDDTGALFTPELDAKEAAQKRADDRLLSQEKISFKLTKSTKSLDKSNQVTVSRLFNKPYQPQAVEASSAPNHSQSQSFWVLMIGIATLPLLVLAFMLGQLLSKRSFDKRHG